MRLWEDEQRGYIQSDGGIFFVILYHMQPQLEVGDETVFNVAEGEL